uniref:Uncharacterized protein n=1 Tax=Heliothis virescens TaxID=7102 RepID=A0A2A4K4T2_HELVI
MRATHRRRRPEPTAAVAYIGRNGKYISSRAKSPLHTPGVAGPDRARGGALINIYYRYFGNRGVSFGEGAEYTQLNEAGPPPPRLAGAVEHARANTALFLHSVTTLANSQCLQPGVMRYCKHGLATEGRVADRAPSASRPAAGPVALRLRRAGGSARRGRQAALAARHAGLPVVTRSERSLRLLPASLFKSQWRA